MPFFRAGALSATASLLMLCAAPTFALVEMQEDALADVTGTGIAIVLNDIRVTASPTSYLEFTGSTPAGGSPYQRADIRWYGLSITGSDGASGSTWSGTCNSGILDLGCPQGGYVSEFAPHDNPLLLRVYDYTGVDYQGTANVTRTVFEVELPSAHEPYRFAFWGQLSVNNGASKLQVQNIWNNVDQSGTSIQIFQHSDTSDPTFGLLYHNRFSADVRMSLNQTLFSPDTLDMVPEFDDTEGLYIHDYRVYFPMGQLHYQSLIANDVAVGNGNFILEVTPLPNQANAYNYHYGRTIADDPTGGYDRAVRGASYDETHGYLRMGDWVGTQNYAFYNVSGNPRASFGEPAAGACMADRVTCAKNTGNSTTDGMFFSAYPGNTFTNYNVGQHYTTSPGNVSAPTTTSNMSTINLGDSQINGMLIQHMRITTLGSN